MRSLAIIVAVILLWIPANKNQAIDDVPAENLIAAAALLGQEIEISADQLQQILDSFDNLTITNVRVAEEKDSLAYLRFISDGVHRYTCSFEAGWLGHTVRVHYWADMRISNARFTVVESKGWNLLNWGILGTSIVNANVNAYIESNGWSVQIRFDGVLQLWVVGILVKEQPLNATCFRSP